MSISSDEVNCLIYRYLQENGFTHSAFTFAYESLVIKSSAAQTEIPPGALITFLQKGLEYIAIEEHIAEDGTIQEFENNFTLMSPVICEALAVKDDRRIRTKVPASSANSQGPTSVKSDNNAMDVDGNDEGQKQFVSSEIAPSSSQVNDTTGARLLYLRGHQADVHNFAWNPNQRQLATAALDGVSRLWGLWEMSNDKWDSLDTELSIKTSLLPHKVSNSQKLYEVSFVNWNPEGTLLATACNDGSGRVWDQTGALLHTLQGGHEGTMFSIKWSKNSQYLVSRGSDGQTVVWSAIDGKIVKTITPHADAGSEVDWKDSDVFATCGGKDMAVVICSVSAGENPVKKFTEHTQEVNSVVWSPSGEFLASVSDDQTAKIWTLEEGLKHDLRGHTQEVLSAKWTSTGHNSKNPEIPLYLCTASVDGSVKIWDALAGQLVHTLAKYSTAVCSIAISPEGKWLASGTHSGRVVVWNMANGDAVQEFRVGSGDNYEVAWSHDGSLLSASFVNGALVVIQTSDFLRSSSNSSDVSSTGSVSQT